MLNVAGVKFRKNDKIYYFDAGNLTLKKGDLVIVETYGKLEYRTRSDQDHKQSKNKKNKNYGLELATVEVGSVFINDDLFKGFNEKGDINVRRILRKVNKNDLKQLEKNIKREKYAAKMFKEKALKYNLDMKLIDVQLSFDLNKILFFFVAEGRIDFREIVKELAKIFKMRIEFRQIGVRDEAKFLNGIGICGRTLCCSTFLKEFQPVSIKMAKDQNISLNPTKISGACGRLMCCLKYEQDTYEELKKKTFNTGDIINTPLGVGEVISFNILKQVLKAAVRKNNNDTPSIYHFNTSEVQMIKKVKVKEEIEPKDLKGILD